MTGMEHAIEQAARAEADRKSRDEHWCGDRAVFTAGAEWAVAHLRESGILAPAPLREEWGIEGPDGEQVKCASPQSASINAMTEGWRMIRRYRTDWTHFDPSRRAEGDGRAEHVPAVDCEDHRPRQHRDGKPPWCHACGMDANGLRPVFKFDHLLHDGKADL